MVRSVETPNPTRMDCRSIAATDYPVRPSPVARLDSSLTPGCDGFVRLEEAPRVRHDLVDVLLRIFPGIDGHLGVRGEAGHLHRDLVRVRGHVVRRYQQRRLDGAHEIA